MEIDVRYNNKFQEHVLVNLKNGCIRLRVQYLIFCQNSQLFNIFLKILSILLQLVSSRLNRYKYIRTSF
jgi:hypothetical protein